MIENVYKYFFGTKTKMPLPWRHFMKVNILSKREATLLFLHSFIVLSCFPRPVRWSSASVCRIYEWTGWFPYLIYFPYEETLVGCWVLHPYGCCEKHPPTPLLPLVPLFVLVFQHQSPGIWSKSLSVFSRHFRPLS